MFRDVARAALFASLTLVLWMLARPAWAMPAGLCDDRGASAIASPPALEAPDGAIERARAQRPCGGDDVAGRATIRHGRQSASAFAARRAGALPVFCIAVPSAPDQAAEPLRPAYRPTRCGVRLRVERPPRA
jgi:hypothetical protein